MLKKINRLTKEKDFNQVFKKSRSSYDKIIGIKAVKNDLSYNRFGILVSAKISKKAVVRNKIKRRIREVIRLHLKDIPKGHDFVFITLPPIIDKSYQELAIVIAKNLKNLKLL